MQAVLRPLVFADAVAGALAAAGFHIPPLKRLKVVALLIGNAFFQYATQAARFVWPSYADSQKMPGVLWINLTFVLSILCGISSGILQGCCEGGVRKAHPGRFPPTPFEAALAAYRDARAQQEEERQAQLESQLHFEGGASMRMRVVDKDVVAPLPNAARWRMNSSCANSEATGRVSLMGNRSHSESTLASTNVNV